MSKNKYSLFISILARDNPIDGGGSFRALKATTVDEARKEAQAIIDEDAPQDSCDFCCDFAILVETPAFMDILVQL